MKSSLTSQTLAVVTLVLSVSEVSGGRRPRPNKKKNKLTSKAVKQPPFLRSVPSGSSKAGKVCEIKEQQPLISRVYTASNQPNNTVLVYDRNVQTGALSFVGNVATDGDGFQLTGPNINPAPPVQDPLAASNSVTVAGKCLLVVNAGSDNFSSFRITRDGTGLEFVDTYQSALGAVGDDGTIPVSLAEREGLVYVLNVGGDGSIQGYNLKQYNCRLTSIGDAISLNQTVPTSAIPPVLTSTPAQIDFAPDGNALVITIKQNDGGDPDLVNQTGSLNVYDVNQTDGSAGNLVQTPLLRDGQGTIPFSFTFDSVGNLLLLEVFGNNDMLINGGQLNVISNIDTNLPVIESEAAADSGESCWIEYNPILSCVYVANNNGDSISSFTLSDDQNVTLVSNETALLNKPIDLAQSEDYKYLYGLSTGHTSDFQPRIYVYEMECGCTLKEVQMITDGLLNETARNVTDGVVNGYAGLDMFTGLL